MKKHYINAVTQLLLEGRDVAVVLKNLEKVLTLKGHNGIHTQILAGVVQKLEAHHSTEGSTVIVADKDDVAVLQSAIATSLAKLGATESVQNVVTDKTLIGGYIALHNGRAIDASYKQKLVTLYKAITK